MSHPYKSVAYKFFFNNDFSNVLIDEAERGKKEKAWEGAGGSSHYFVMAKKKLAILLIAFYKFTLLYLKLSTNCIFIILLKM